MTESVWFAMLSSPHQEDREAAAVGLRIEGYSDAASVVRQVSATQGPRAAARELAYGTADVPLTDFDLDHLREARQALEAGRLAEFLERRHRDRRFDRSLRKGAPLRADQIDRMMVGYERKLVAYRLETYARYVAMRAAHAEADAGWRQAVVEGRVPEAELRRYWIVADDSRLCARCAPIPALNSKGVGLNESFRTPLDGDVTGPPVCPRCRCSVFIRRERPGIRPAPAPGTTRFQFPDT